MSAAQRTMYEDLISAMKKRIARQDDASDSDTSIKHQTNRGNKLKRKAKYVSRGHLAQADGPRTYKRRIFYNGYPRDVISQNPPRVDADGDVVEDDEDSDLTPAEDDPYADVKIESLLRPLTSAADLDKHPSMSIPYKEKHLDEMVQRTQEMVFREQNSLWRMKKIATALRGDAPWVPSSSFISDQDNKLFKNLDPFAYASSLNQATGTLGWGFNGELASPAEVEVDAGIQTDGPDSLIPNGDVQMAVSAKAKDSAGIDVPEESASTAIAQKGQHSGKLHGSQANEHDAPAFTTEQDGREPNVGSGGEHAITNGVAKDTAEPHKDDQQSPTDAPQSDSTNHETHKQHINGADPSTSENTAMTNGESIAGPSVNQEPYNNTNPPLQPTTTNVSHIPSPPPDEPASPIQDQQAPAPRLTRARAQAHANINSRDASIPPSEIYRPISIHPFFLPPAKALPNSTNGLPPNIASESRRLVHLYIQKQEEVVRQCNSLLDGLRKALRLKKMVWEWCRSEAHVGEMSDGEDWIDPEAWGLDEPLRKGEEVDDDEGAAGTYMTAKKTRNRRAAG